MRGRAKFLGAVALGATLWGTVFCTAALSDDAWRAEFEAACSRTSEAMTLSAAELSALIERCDRLRKTVETQEETVAKVYLKRLEKCRNLYVYMLDYKKAQQPAP